MAQILTPEQAQHLADKGLVRKPFLRDPAVPHQPLMLATTDGRLSLTCNCMRTSGSGPSLKGASYDVIEARACWEPGEANARWREHVGEAEARKPHIFPRRKPGDSAYRHGCRCKDCTRGNRESHARKAAGRAARREDVPHGTYGGYVNWGCRCPECLRMGSLRNALPGARRNLAAGRPLTALQAEALRVQDEVREATA